MRPNSKEYLEFERWNQPQPTHHPHGTEEDIRANLKKLNLRSWRLEGNRLIAQTDMGQLVQYIPVDYILTGEDAKGMPIFEKINFDRKKTVVVE